ncbi:dynein regulatory complex protein 9-like [Anguilla anguilla]|uniref:dynein regulatory complex protein 9-like n=1 Tax=Anguilla anguilla TaxID=7936 RepID=UPI0015AA243D|nr:dynein regulatory complex protein 9-like [Anguilla anguilla]XP_035239948.1 dynein regulatory complex protein 9-like [Anguilla anguilla]XP_035239949.1 dynein regulatory complex protein 9-like [Anguilla anguilla]
MAAQWSTVERLRVISVLQDCEDQLAVLGHIRPKTCVGHLEMQEQRNGVTQQIQTEEAGLAKSKKEMRSQRESDVISENKELSPEPLAQVEYDRNFVAQVITNLLKELRETGTFHSLLSTIEEEKKRKARIRDFILSEEEGRRRTKVLQRQLLDIRKEKVLELQRRDEMIAHLKDQLQETKAKTDLEMKYVAKSSELQVYQEQKLNSMKEKELEAEIKRLHEMLEEERLSHIELERFLKEDQLALEEKLEMWMERYEKDMEDKQHELNTLKNNRASNLARLQELAKKYRESEQVVIADRVEKENLRREREKEEMEWAFAIKLQSWWRGTMVRQGLGPFKKGKKPKAKEGKKGKKKKKK